MNILIMLVALLALPIGVVLASLTKQEMLDGKKYIFFLKIFTLATVIFLFLIQVISIWLSLIVSLFFMPALFYAHTKNLPSYVYYIFLAFMLYSSKTASVPIMIFLYGIVSVAWNYRGDTFLIEIKRIFRPCMAYLAACLILLI
ncbi:MAG: hypothetical protein NDI94_02020 [Candidatus Woesearchaeota archaeon]|nr:hypothetical protein [Candidatus Woesearchaeota archaeon]